MSSGPITETVTLSQARDLIGCLSHEQSVLLLAPPGVGKSDVVHQAARAAGLECKSLLGTQIAPEDVSGVPRIVGERSVFCPPRVLLPENATKFCLFLDELPACAPDVQKAFYSLLLERRIGEYLLPEGTWVVAAGNRAEDKALVRTISSALVNRVLILNVRIDVPEWITWAHANYVRADVVAFIEQNPDALLRPVPDKVAPFSTPRAWASLARALDLVGARGQLTPALVRALAVGRVSEDDARRFATAWLGSPAESTALEEKLNWALAELGLSARAHNCLESESIATVRELVRRNDDELLEVRNFSETTLREVKAKLALHGLSLGMKV
ncbi:DNA-directed RNA polymerase subunit alpha C-terminal domain-containing protein [Gemmata palustris]|uniref:DNA-directed RNA polymerase subunit alpha C-terminal domain-containing protein n=1 Tax=Gemmata palustris TaxID=2822762 RepID=UPI001FE459D9|nr:DNA-directed RNA polymerase subunit alpha C-terminal domain-containing protein [Gemmata palustris]